ncbi:MAG: hypothetical protein HOP26_01045 [Methylotenera sp.]|nr:hypothetical protein [Methylotenera sp.]
MGNQKVLVNNTLLSGNAKVSEPMVDSHGLIKGFIIDNPKGFDLQVDLQHFLLNEENAEENKKLRQTIYDTYKLAAQSVPAFTPLAECVAQTSQHILHSEANKPEGVFSNIIYLENTLKTIDNNLADTLPVVNIAGNPTLPDREISVEVDTDAGHVKTIAKIEQQNKYYLGKDGLWYTTNPLEVITHEIAHACKDLQNLTKAGDFAYESSKKQGITPEDEKRVINFVNQVLLEPRGMSGRDLNSDTAVKPNNATVGNYAPLDAMGIERLKHAPIPNELKSYSQPKVIDFNSHSKNNSHDFTRESSFVHPITLGQLKRELAAFDSEHQQSFVFSRISEVMKGNGFSQKQASDDADLVLC